MANTPSDIPDDLPSDVYDRVDSSLSDRFERDTELVNAQRYIPKGYSHEDNQPSSLVELMKEYDEDMEDEDNEDLTEINDANPTIEHNLEMMKGMFEGSMPYLISTEESQGARKIGDYLLVRANFFYNQDGRIKQFDNPQHVDYRTRESHSEGGMHVILNNKLFSEKPYRVMRVHYSKDAPLLVQLTLNETVRKYNEKHAFVPKKHK